MDLRRLPDHLPPPPDAEVEPSYPDLPRISAARSIAAQFPLDVFTSGMKPCSDVSPKACFELGIPEPSHRRAVELAYDTRDKTWLWPGVYPSVADAIAARRQLHMEARWQLLSLALDFESAAELGESYSEHTGEPDGFDQILQRMQPPHANCDVLGFEPLTCGYHGIEHSWREYALAPLVKQALNVEPNPNGFLSTLAEATRVGN